MSILVSLQHEDGLGSLFMLLSSTKETLKHSTEELEDATLGFRTLGGMARLGRTVLAMVAVMTTRSLSAVLAGDSTIGGIHGLINRSRSRSRSRMGG